MPNTNRSQHIDPIQPKEISLQQPKQVRNAETTQHTRAKENNQTKVIYEQRIYLRVVIFEQTFDTTFGDNLFFSLFIG
jgi:hypothetical protein